VKQYIDLTSTWCDVTDVRLMLCTHAIELILMLLMFDYQGILHNDSKKHQT
jgi:hypothetical protein